MGINAVVIVENRNGISLREFVEQLKADPWGRHAIWGDDPDDYLEEWGEFRWENKTYFTWYYSPRYPHLRLLDPDWEEEHPDPDNPVQLTFLKIMLVVERLAGGPIYVGNDVISVKSPHQCVDREKFFLPFELDSILPRWREVANYEVKEPRLVF